MGGWDGGSEGGRVDCYIHIIILVCSIAIQWRHSI